LAGKGNKNQEMAGKRPNGRKKWQESRSFPALQGYKFLKNGSKRPTDSAAHKLLEADQLKTPNRRRGPQKTITAPPQKAKLGAAARTLP